MDVVLDLDLDFFVWPKIHYPHWKGRAPLRECPHVASAESVRTFLEQRCHLSKDSYVLGQEFRDHHHAFYEWRRWLLDGRLTAPFVVVHVDAHADLGVGSSAWKYLETELLGLPLAERAKPRRGKNGLNLANYLLFAIANRWVHELTYVYPTNPSPPSPVRQRNPAVPSIEDIAKELGGIDGYDDDQPPTNDVPACCFENEDWKTEKIQLKHYRPQDWPNRSKSIGLEPSVPFHWAAGREFQFKGFTHMVVSQSPRYTPESADALLPVIREYFRPE
ncbi:MAG: UPF0489 family protein [Acidobacteriia bacterium]|nr:UPF0489 family protein [Terriglobia bacterium]